MRFSSGVKGGDLSISTARGLVRPEVTSAIEGSITVFLSVWRKKLSSFIRSCIGDVIYYRYETAKIK
jgi:hypothetical protein